MLGLRVGQACIAYYRQPLLFVSINTTYDPHLGLDKNKNKKHFHFPFTLLQI